MGNFKAIFSYLLQNSIAIRYFMNLFLSFSIVFITNRVNYRTNGIQMLAIQLLHCLILAFTLSG